MTKAKNSPFLEACAEHARKFMMSTVEAKSPIELAELFYGNNYLRRDMNSDARIFKKSLDLGVEGYNGIYHILEDRNLLEEIYTLAFADYAEKNKNKNIDGGEYLGDVEMKWGKLK